jgi:CheY-like chemotaxis protein
MDRLTARAAPRRAGVAQGLQVLLVDDDLDARRATERTLGRHRARVITASDGFESLRVLYTLRPDVILTDLRMPDLDGYELIHILRADPHWMHVPVIALTEVGEDADYVDTLTLGFAAHLVKPVGPTALATTLRRLFSRAA